MNEQERNEQSADSTVAVEERVDRFELRMGQPAVNQCGEFTFVVEIPLERVEGLSHLVRRWRYEGGGGKRGILRPDPVMG